MVFCNVVIVRIGSVDLGRHNPYFNRWFSAIIYKGKGTDTLFIVTILILIDGFLQ